MRYLNKFLNILVPLCIGLFVLSLIPIQVSLKPKLHDFNAVRHTHGLLRIPKQACFTTRPYEKIPFYEISYNSFTNNIDVKKTICLPKRRLLSSEFVGEYDTYTISNDSTLIMFFDYNNDSREYRLVTEGRSLKLDSATFFGVIYDIQLTIEDQISLE